MTPRFVTFGFSRSTRAILGLAAIAVCPAYEHSLAGSEAKKVEASSQRTADDDPIAALQEYVATHSSLLRHAPTSGDEAAGPPLKNPGGEFLAQTAPADAFGWTTKVHKHRDAANAETVKPAKTGRSKGATGASKLGAKVPQQIPVPTNAEKTAAGQTDDLLVPIEPQKRNKSSRSNSSQEPGAANAEHLALFVEGRYPSANTCGTCHPKHFKEWSVSQHAYAQLSPAYLSLNNKINQLSNGSNGDFCLRCHSPVGADLGESPYASNLDRHPTSREGITCVVCHRINQAYNKASGRLALVEGGLTEPIFGPEGNAGVENVLEKPNKFRVVTDPEEQGRKLHAEARVFDQIRTPVFCGTCHDVTLFNGFRLEEAYSEYRLSPAAARGETCQDCHMGKEQGVASGYETGPAAIVGDQPTKSRRLTSHLFSGPDYSLVHPGIFPHNQRAAAFKTLREWLLFKHEEGWGTEKFESKIPKGYKFPKAWESADDRYDAREILNEQFKLLDYARVKRLEVLRNGYLLGDTIVGRADEGGLSFQVQVRNGTDGHNVPTGFTGERLIWLDVAVKDRDGTVVFRSGDRDPNGDLRDGHSSYVHAGKMSRDAHLFSLQSIFVTQNGRGGEIEHVIPIPFPSFALPRVLPSTTSLVFTGEPATERNHKKGIEPNGERWANYSVDGSALTGRPPYKATIKLKSQPIPVNLLIAMQSVGFDYAMTPRMLADKLIAGTQTIWEKEIVLGTKAAR